MARPNRRILVCLLAFCAVMLPSHARPQDKGEPGKFDFYLMNIAAPADFCHVPGAGPACKPPQSFVLHGLWTQNNNGTYPVNCSEERGPENYNRFLDMTPDLPLLQHEWEKHGTCSGVGAEKFFRMEREAYGALKIPAQIARGDQELNLKTTDVMADFYKANPGFPAESILLSCSANRLTAVEACFSKTLKPIRCEGLHTCAAAMVTLHAADVSAR